jgi:transposase
MGRRKRLFVLNNTIICLWLCALKNSAIPVKTVAPIGRLKVILSNPDIQSQNHVRYKIASLLTEKVSLSFIAKSCQVSLTSVIRTLKEFKSYLPKQSKKILPRVLMVDEFRSHASIEDKMSFICADGETGK